MERNSAYELGVQCARLDLESDWNAASRLSNSEYVEFNRGFQDEVRTSRQFGIAFVVAMLAIACLSIVAAMAK